MATAETPILTTVAAVYNYDESTKSWTSVDDGGSRVFIFHNRTQRAYRIIGISAKTEQYIMNTPVYKGLVHQKVSDMFVQWRDTKTIFGLSFSSAAECNKFCQGLSSAVVKLNAMSAAIPPPIARPPSVGSLQQAKSAVDPPRSLLKNPPAQLGPREKVVLEIFSTEKDYVQNLTLLVEECYQPCVKGKYKSIFTASEQKQIFSNIEIVRSINIRLYQQLTERLDRWNNKQLIGDVFLEMIPFFKVYQEYYTNYEAGIDLLTKLSKKKDVAGFLKYCEEEVTSGHKLAFLLVTPVQRIPRYNLLVKELLKHTADSHPDYANLDKALRQMQEFTSTINESVRETDNYRKLAELVKDNKKYVGFEKIVADNRTLAYETDVEVKMGPKMYTWMLLFNDILAFAAKHPTKSSRRNVEEVLSLEYVWFEDLAGLGSQTVLRVVTPEQMFLVETPSVQDKHKWMALSQRTINKHLQKKNITFEGQVRQFAHSFENGDKYDGDWEYGKPNGKGAYWYSSGNMYTGKFRDGKPHGQGKLLYKSGGAYEGEWKQGRPDGYGKLVNGPAVYEGWWVQGSKSGKGRMKWPNNELYEGDWEADRRCGDGTLTTETITYEGGWKNDLYEGEGRLETPLYTHTGQWKENMASGTGTRIKPNGDKYEGEWKAGQYDGQGTFTSGDGCVVYRGTYAEGRMNGTGVLTVKSIGEYRGEFKEDRKHGKGKFTYEDGSTYEGTWANDRREGEGVYTHPSGERYEGLWHSDRRFGRGVKAAADGSTYDGEWVNDRMEGRGTIRWSNGSSYSGTWVSGTMHGRGVWANADESIKYVGEFANNLPHGTGSYSCSVFSYEGEWQSGRPHGSGTYIDVSTQTTFVGKWVSGARDGEAKLTLKNGVVHEMFWKEDVMEAPLPIVLPPLLPSPHLHWN